MVDVRVTSHDRALEHPSLVNTVDDDAGVDRSCAHLERLRFGPATHHLGEHATGHPGSRSAPDQSQHGGRQVHVAGWDFADDSLLEGRASCDESGLQVCSAQRSMTRHAGERDLSFEPVLVDAVCPIPGR